MSTKYQYDRPDELFELFESDPQIVIERRRIDFYTNKNEEEYFNVNETFTIQNKSESPIYEFYLNIEQFRINLIVTDSDGTELPYIPRESFQNFVKKDNITNISDIRKFGILYIVLPENKKISSGETRVIYLSYIYPYKKWKIKYEGNLILKTFRRSARWLLNIFFNEDITQYTFDTSSVNHTYFSVLGTDHATVEPLFIVGADKETGDTINFDDEEIRNSMGFYNGNGYFTFHLNQFTNEKLGLPKRLILVFVSKAETERKRLLKSFFLIITLNALVVYIYEYRFFFENFGVESSMFLLMLSLLISVFTLSLLPIHSRPIKFRNIILYASALILGSFAIGAYYLVAYFLLPVLLHF